MSDPLRRDTVLRRSPRHLNPAEVDRLMAAAQRPGRHGHRDATMILLAYGHGLCVSELVEIRRDQVDLDNKQLHIRRRRSGMQSIHALTDPEVEALGKLLNNSPDTAHVFVSERHFPMTCANVRRLVARAGETAGLNMPVHPHMLRHSTGFKLANDGEDIGSIQRYLGHRNIQHTAVYSREARRKDQTSARNASVFA